jgi:hypothetical protein
MVAEQRRWNSTGGDGVRHVFGREVGPVPEVAVVASGWQAGTLQDRDDVSSTIRSPPVSPKRRMSIAELSPSS